ncbi:Annexin D4 [Bienertia sinuspersici]
MSRYLMRTGDIKTMHTAIKCLGVDEKALISIAGKLEPDGKNSLRKATPCLFSTDERHFEKSNEQQNAVVLWTMHPWERDARFFKEALTRGTKGYSLIIEVACTRSSEELLGARKAYHSIFHSSVEEDVASHVHGYKRKVRYSLPFPCIISAARGCTNISFRYSYSCWILIRYQCFMDS